MTRKRFEVTRDEMSKEEIVFNDLTDNLFGYLAQIGLRRTSQEMEGDVFGEVDYRAAYDAVVKLARAASEECVQIRDKMLSSDAK